MNDSLRKIYDTIICYEDETIEAGKRLDDEVKNVIMPYEKKLNINELEELKALLYGISNYSEREGFILGVKWAVKLLMEILSN